ncbi:MULTISPECIES: LysR family transcriptional regulator [unclassified Rhizobium]|uniref:LysR family transcriptional regulator n=1 Tax=unclassified Rhizobium TaxID=2613769 RepID=UPI00070109EA|nr:MULTISPECIES: LysR family transcriptional regulator [unclassified Rhizobium]KQV34967.1 hypothetical protein ASC86_12125 [Rhizobium sp. Root1212]
MMKISGADLHLLSVFDSVVRNGGFSAAQAELGLSQPTISNHITALETRLGVILCQRGRRGFQLTDKGRQVHEIAVDLLRRIDHHSMSLTALKGSLVGQLKIAVVDCVASDPEFRLTEVVHRLNDEAPGIRIEIEVEKPGGVLRRLAEGEIHAGIGSFDNKIKGLSYISLYEERHSVYCGKGHPLFSTPAESITQQDMDKCVWVHRGYWSRERKKSQQVIEADRIVDQIEAQLLFTLSGDYIGLLPDHAAASYLACGRLRKLPPHEDNFDCMMQLVYRSGTHPKTFQVFREMLVGLYRPRTPGRGSSTRL